MNPARPSSTDDPSHFGRVDALRGLGAIVVAGYHFSGCVLHGTTLLPQEPWGNAAPIQNAIGRLAVWLLPGHLAVFGFFLISGFVLRLSLARGPRSVLAASIRFLIARLWRFYPIVAAGTIVAMFQVTTLPEFRTVAANVLLLDVSLNPPLWSLQVELLMAPAVLALYFTERRWGPRPVALAAFVTTGLAFVPSWAIWRPLSTTFFIFCLGILIPTVGRRFALGLSGVGAVAWLVGSASVFAAVSPCLGPYSRFTEVIGGYAGATVLSLVAYRPDLRMLRVLDLGILRKAGSAAGSFYVLHMMTVPAMLYVASHIVPPAWSMAAPALVGVGVIVMWLVVITPIMMLVTLVVEDPGISLGRRLTRALGLNRHPKRIHVAASPLPNQLAA